MTYRSFFVRIFRILFSTVSIGSLLFSLQCRGQFPSTLAPEVADIRAPTPPMGWNSWDCFGMDVTERQVRATADYMAKNMKKAGWQYVVVDMGWYFGDGLTTTNFKSAKEPAQCLDEYGRLIPNVHKFPSAAGGRGFRPLADYIHSLGLKFGIHILRGLPWQAAEQNLPIKGTPYHARGIVDPQTSCRWYAGLLGIDLSKPGAREYYQTIVDLYAEWGVDFIKADDLERPYFRHDVEALGAAIAQSGRPIVLGLSAGPIPIAEGAHLKAHSTMWRISADVWDDWSFVKAQFSQCRIWQDYVTPGHWADCDILPIGRLRINGTDDILAKAIGRRPGDLVNELSRLSPNEQHSVLTDSARRN